MASPYEKKYCHCCNQIVSNHVTYQRENPYKYPEQYRWYACNKESIGKLKYNCKEITSQEALDPSGPKTDMLFPIEKGYYKVMDRLLIKCAVKAVLWDMNAVAIVNK